jgi:hypothetical protein
MTSSYVTVTESTSATDVTAVAFDLWYEDRAKEIRAHLAKMNANADKAEQHRTSALQVLKSVEKKLTADGKLDTIRFDLFKAKVCPELSTSQAYVKLAILTGKLSIEDHRKKQNQRQKKARDKKKAASGGPNGVVAGNGSDVEASTEARKAEMARLAGEDVPAGGPIFVTVTDDNGKPLTRAQEKAWGDAEMARGRSVSGDTKQVKKGSSEWYRGEFLSACHSYLPRLGLVDLREVEKAVAAIITPRLAELEAAAVAATTKKAA